RIHDILPTIAVEIDGVALEGSRHELGRTEGASPRTFQMLGGNIAVFENFERGQKFFAEIALPPADAGKRRGRLHHWALSTLCTEIGFDPPDRGENVAIDPVGFF